MHASVWEWRKQAPARSDGQMNNLQQKLLARIAEKGPIPLSDYMEACLLDPEFGYYSGPQPIGAHGAFTTAPEISQMFGELLGICLAKSWIDQGMPGQFVLAELGPGRGTLMVDLLRATAQIDGFNSSARLHLVERGPQLRGQQELLLQAYDPFMCSDASELPDLPLFLVANEFFDALPVRQFRKSKEGWTEVLVGSRSGQLIFCESSPVACASIDLPERDVPPGEIIELRPEADRIIRVISRLIGSNGGAAIIVDYGDWNLRGSTLQALRNHRKSTPLSNPGVADLTTHVDFGALARAAKGVSVSPMITQGEFLGRLGIAERAAALAAKASRAQSLDLDLAVRRLTSPNEMGTLFKVLALYPGNAPAPPGFSE